MIRLNTFVVLLSIVVMGINGMGFSRKVFVKCININERYCQEKNDYFRFNDGCNVCICRETKMVCPETRCENYTTINKRHKYCQEIRKKNVLNYRKFITSTRFTTNTKTGIRRYKKMKWSNYFGNWWNQRKYHKTSFNKNTYLTRLNYLKRRQAVYLKMINKLKTRKKKIRKMIKKMKKKYLKSKKKYPYSMATRFLKYKMKRQKSLVKIVKRRLRRYYKRYKKIRKSIRKISKKMNLEKDQIKKKSKKKLFEKNKYKRDWLKRLRDLYKKHKDRIKEVKKKRQKLVYEERMRKNKYKRKMPTHNKKRSQIKKKLSDIIRRIRKHMQRIRKKYLKAEGDRKINGNKQKKIKKLRKDEFLKREITKYKLLDKRKKEEIARIKRKEKVKRMDEMKRKENIKRKDHEKRKKSINRNEYVRIKENSKKEKISKKRKNKEEKEKIKRKDKIERIQHIKKVKKQNRLKENVKRDKNNPIKDHMGNTNHNPNFIGVKKHLIVKPELQKRIRIVSPYADMITFLEQKDENTVHKTPSSESKSTKNNLLRENREITKNINELKLYLKNHLQFPNTTTDTAFREKLNEILPIVRRLNFTSDATDKELMKMYRDRKLVPLTALQRAYLRTINNNMYKNYLKLSRLNLLEQRMHRQWKSRNKDSNQIGRIQKEEPDLKIRPSSYNGHSVPLATNGVVIGYQTFYLTLLIPNIIILFHQW